MAGPVTHILLALKLFQCGLLDEQNVDVNSFLIGTSFPDIRYIARIDRNKTHIAPISWQDVLNEPSAFHAGMKFHALVDHMREAFLIEHNIYAQLPSSPYLSQCMKFVEDDILYNQIDSWAEIKQIFDTIVPEERSFGIPEKTIKQWHAIIKWYCSKPPQQDILVKSIRLAGPFLSKKIDHFSRLIKTLEKMPLMRATTVSFYDEFDQLIG